MFHVAGPHVVNTVTEQRLTVKIVLLSQRLVNIPSVISTFINLVKFELLQPLYPKMNDNGIYSSFLS